MRGEVMEFLAAMAKTDDEDRRRSEYVDATSDQIDRVGASNSAA
jgi:hypothetical protein